MARAGTGGTTAAEIDAAMHFPSSGRDAQMNALTRGLATQGQRASPCRRPPRVVRLARHPPHRS